jgi:hypothetical protein
MTIDAAYDYARRLVDLESQGGSDIEGALDRIERSYGIGGNALQHLRSRRAKKCDISLYARIKAAYFDLCARQARALLHEIEIEEALGDETNSDLGDRLMAIAQEAAEKKAAALRGGR